MLRRAHGLSLCLSILLDFIFMLLLLASGFLGILLIWMPIFWIALAIKLMENDEPILSVGINGVVLSSRITSNEFIDWDDVQKLSVLGFGISTLPLLNFKFLIIKTKNRKQFDGVSKIFVPAALFGSLLLPTRLIKGGAKGVEQMLKVLERIQIDQRHEAAHRGHGQSFIEAQHSEIGWHMLRNVTFPYRPGTANLDNVEEQAFVDLVLSNAALHRDLLPKELEAKMRQEPVFRELESKARQMHQGILSDSANQQKAPLLNGKPLT